ncbi:hypothetical protein GCM10025876_17310 [Demequina litorisediminis]|uniref:Uncharacterized protein n=1 Tax=Demequina litorisediminis TaxID=1849022 RepID=A0ABQ6IFK7_9MICO|nr:hypothetical protein GCM10025876_17310 [Demequina litorisediminis]
MLAPHRRQTVRAIVGRVARSSDAEQAAVQQPKGHTEHVFAGKVATRRIGIRDRACGGQARGDGEDPRMLGAIPALTPRGVVQVLPPSRLIRSERLQVTLRVRADPHVDPGRRNREPSDPVPLDGIAHRGPLGIPVCPAGAGASAGDPRLGGAGSTQAGHGPTVGRCRGAVARSAGREALTYLRQHPR